MLNAHFHVSVSPPGKTDRQRDGEKREEERQTERDGEKRDGDTHLHRQPEGIFWNFTEGE